MTWRVGDTIQDPSRPTDEPWGVTVVQRYRTDYRDGTQCLLVQDCMGNEYDVYVSLAVAVEAER